MLLRFGTCNKSITSLGEILQRSRMMRMNSLSLIAPEVESFRLCVEGISDPMEAREGDGAVVSAASRFPCNEMTCEVSRVGAWVATCGGGAGCDGWRVGVSDAVGRTSTCAGCGAGE